MALTLTYNSDDNDDNLDYNRNAIDLDQCNEAIGLGNIALPLTLIIKATILTLTILTVTLTLTIIL
jgi:hypothetical protein